MTPRPTEFKYYSVNQYGVVHGLPPGESKVYVKKGRLWSIIFCSKTMSYLRVRTAQLWRLGLLATGLDQKAEMDNLYQYCQTSYIRDSQYEDIKRCIRKG